MTAKHTPGPWVIDGHNLSSVIRCIRPKGHPDARHACGDYEQIATSCGENWKANAHLVAAAPDLLEMVKLLEKSLEYYIAIDQRAGDEDSARAKTITLNIVRVSISKAEGRS